MKTDLDELSDALERAIAARARVVHAEREVKRAEDAVFLARLQYESAMAALDKVRMKEKL